MRLTHRPDLRALLLGTVGLGCTSSTETPDETPPTLVAASFRDAQTLRLSFSEPIADPSAVDTQAFRLSLGVRDVSSTVYYALRYDGFYDDGGASYGGDDGPISDGDPTLDPAGADPTDATATDPGDTTDPTADPTVDPGESGYDDAEAGYDEGEGEGGYDEGGYAAPTTPIDAFTRSIPPLAIMDLDVSAIASVAGDATKIDLTLAAAVTDGGVCQALASFTADALKAGLFLHYRPGTNALADAAGNPLAAIAPHWVESRASSYAELQGDFPKLDPYLPIPCP